jgi:hypothetical protein
MRVRRAGWSETCVDDINTQAKLGHAMCVIGRELADEQSDRVQHVCKFAA